MAGFRRAGHIFYQIGNFFCLSTLFTLVLTARQRIESVDMIGISLVCNYGIEFCQQLSQQNVGVAIYSQLDSTQQGSLHVNLNLLLKQQITLKQLHYQMKLNVEYFDVWQILPAYVLKNSTRSRECIYIYIAFSIPFLQKSYINYLLKLKCVCLI